MTKIFNKIKKILETNNFAKLIQISMNRLLLKTPIGNKVIHRPYHISAQDSDLYYYPDLPFKSVSIISLLVEPINLNLLKQVLESYTSQSFKGESEIFFVNYTGASFFQDSDIQKDPAMAFKVYTDLETAIKQVSGDFILITNAHHYLDRDYTSNHLLAHIYQNCDISMGYSIPKFDCSLAYKTYLLDSINPNSFINFSLEHLGVKREWLFENLSFIALINHHKNSFPWSNLELGYQFYKMGCRLILVKGASVYCTSENINKLNSGLLESFHKHPDLSLILRRWLVENYTINFNNNISSTPKTLKSLKILSYPWHIAHQYELYKLPHEFTLITDAGTWVASGWNLQHRPIPDNVQFRSIRDIDPQDFDLAILHFDENVLSPQNCNGQISKGWGNSFKLFREKINLPKVAICHGTPQFYGQYDIDYAQNNLLQPIESERQKLVDYLGDILVINNSFQAQREWKFQKSKVIWHGFDPTEFAPTTYTKGILSPVSEAVTSRPHYRGYKVYLAVFQDFPQEFLPSILSVKEPHPVLQGNIYAQTRFRNYVDNIREYSIYFNPTIRSPMPRSRGEAMMCGLVTVSLNNHDVDLFIDNGMNGFYADTPTQLREILLYLLQNPEEAHAIGHRGRELAMDIFNHDRYLNAWQETLFDLTKS